MGPFELANILAQLGAARNLEWKKQASTDGAPASTNAAVALQNSLRSTLWVQLRENVAHRTARVTVVPNDATEYWVIIDGTTVSTGGGMGGASAETILIMLKDAINADATVSPIVTASVVDTDNSGAVDVLKIEGDDEADYTITAFDDGIDPGGPEVKADATAISRVRVFLYPRGTLEVPTTFTLARDQVYDDLDYRGLCERLDIAGFDYAYAEVEGADGEFAVRWGVAIKEKGT